MENSDSRRAVGVFSIQAGDLFVRRPEPQLRGGDDSSILHPSRQQILLIKHIHVPIICLFVRLLSRHNQRSLEVQKDPAHKNRCHVRFPEVFSSFPYKVNVTAVNALGKAFMTISFEESTIGKEDVQLGFVTLVFSLISCSIFCLVKTLQRWF